MARKQQVDAAKAKAAKQKKILIGGSVLLLALLAYQGPKTMKLLSGKRAAPTVNASAPTPSTPTTTTTAAASPPPASVAAPSISVATPSTSSSPSSGSSLVSAVEPTADPGQLQQFFHFASKDPFAAQAGPGVPTSSSASSGSSKAGSSSATKTTPSTPTTTLPTSTTPAAAPPGSAVISLNGNLMSVSLSSDFPTSGPIFDRSGALFQLLSLTQSSAKVTIVGGSYADGSQALTLSVGRSVTLQNTADGTRYTLILEPQGTQVPTSGTSTAPASTTPTSTTPTVPSGGSGG